MHSVTSNAVSKAIIQSKVYDFSRTITTSTPTGFTINNFEQISLSSEMQQKNIIGASLSSDYAWVVGTANITDTSIQATWAYVAGANTTVNFKVIVLYKDN